MVSNELRLRGVFCDAVVKVEDVKFQIHKVILCSCSPYFRAVFESCSDLDKRDFELSGLSPETMQLVIDWAYTGSVALSTENVQDLLLVADMYNVMEIVQLCSDFLEEHICAENCIGLWQLTDVILCPKLRGKAYCYILDHFEDVLACEEFQQLSAEELRSIIEKDKLNVKSETVVYEAILHWTNHALKKRRSSFPSLFSKVRLTQLSPEFVRTHLFRNALVQNNPESISVVTNIMQVTDELAINRLSTFRNLRVCNPLVCPRLPGAILLAIGGWSGGNPTHVIEAYNYRTDRWVNVTHQLERPRAYHGSAVLNGSVYLVGGFDRMETFNSMRRLDLSTHTWHEMPPMYYRRCYVSVTVLNGCIYAMGGYNGHRRLSTAEVYNPKTNQWSLIAPMHEQRSDADCTTLHDKVYICGGFNGTECLQTAESYSTETNQWTMIAPMTISRSGISVIAHANHIYAVGGFDGNVRLQSVEAYDPQSNTWRQVTSMITARSNFGIEVVNDQIFAVGGFKSITTTCNVESYDHVVDQWNEACDMDMFRSALSCCVISGIPNMAEYTVSHDALRPLNLIVADEDSS